MNIRTDIRENEYEYEYLSHTVQGKGYQTFSKDRAIDS